MSNKLAAINKWRNVVEMSCMINNDEVVFYSDREMKITEDLSEIIRVGHFDTPRLVLSRPVFNFEIGAGLETHNYPLNEYRDHYEISRPPLVTLFVDAYFKIKDHAEFWRKHLEDKFSPSKFVANYVGSSYYDCMSGGFPIYELMICRMLANDPRVDLNSYVYPGSDSHLEKTGRRDINLGDFLKDTENVEDEFKKEFSFLIKKFSIPRLEAKNE